MAGAYHARAGTRRRARGGLERGSGIMKRGWWVVVGVLALVLVAWLLAGGQPRRTLTGIVQGPDALAYLPPRRDISLTAGPPQPTLTMAEAGLDRKSTRLNSSHSQISYAVFCLKKKKITSIDGRR